MLEFGQLAHVLEAWRSGEDSIEIAQQELRSLLAQADPDEAMALAYLATARLGAPYAARDPWIGMPREKLEDRFTEARSTRSKAEPVGVVDAYEMLHKMDPIRPDWYPDNPNAADDLVALAAGLDSQAFGALVDLMLGAHTLSDRLVLGCAVRAFEDDDDADAIEDAVSKIITRMNKCTPDIGLAVKYIRDGVDEAISKLGRIHFGVPVPLEVMSTQKKQQIDLALSRLRARRVFVQAKSDGVYLHLQKDGETVYIFDEAGIDLVRLPRLRDRGAATATRTVDLWRERIVARAEELAEMVRGLPTERVVLDAEIVGLNDKGDGVVSRERTFEAKTLQLLVFDILGPDATGRDLRTVDYEERHRIMRRLLGDTLPALEPGVFAAEEIAVTGAQAVVKQFEAYTQQNRYEGVILKNPLSRLTDKLRWSSKRIKIKDYTTLDMLLVGFYFSRAKGKPTRYLGALKDPTSNRFHPCAIMVAESKLEEELNQYCLATASDECPSGVADEGKPDRWTDATLVIEVESDGLITRNPEPGFKSVPWTLHQPQQRMIVSIRGDKRRNRVNPLERLLALERAPGY
jgi:ATP-dependent DNA ligase